MGLKTPLGFTAAPNTIKGNVNTLIISGTHEIVRKSDQENLANLAASGGPRNVIVGGVPDTQPLNQTLQQFGNLETVTLPDITVTEAAQVLRGLNCSTVDFSHRLWMGDAFGQSTVTGDLGPLLKALGENKSLSTVVFHTDQLNSEVENAFRTSLPSVNFKFQPNPRDDTWATLYYFFLFRQGTWWILRGLPIAFAVYCFIQNWDKGIEFRRPIYKAVQTAGYYAYLPFEPQMTSEMTAAKKIVSSQYGRADRGY